MSTKEKSTFSHFFKEDAEHVQDIIKGSNGQQVLDKVGTATKEIFPQLISSEKSSEEETTAKWRTLRSFFRTGKGSNPLDKDLTPVIMSPHYTNALVGTEFPVWVADESFEGEGSGCLSLKEMFTKCLQQIAPDEEDAHILKENVERIIHIANQQLSDNKPQLFKSAVINILNELENKLDVSGDEVSNFNSSLKKLKEVLPENGALLPYTNNTSFQLLEAAMLTTHCQARKKLAYDITQLKCRLKDLLRVEREKNPDKAGGKKAKESYDFADSMMNMDKITSIDPGAGAESMGEERVQRITQVVADLEVADELLTQNSFIFVDDVIYGNKSTDWKNLFENSTIAPYKKGSGCDAISDCFNQNISSWTKLFVAKRIGELEFESSYMNDVHDDYFAHFSWENLSTEELSNCPHFVLIADDKQLFDTELNKLSGLIAQNIPVKAVAVKRDNYGTTEIHSQTELGALMISHKNIFVAQSTSISPTFLFDGFTAGLNSFAPAFFNVLNVDEKTHENPYLWTSASVESREFPGFTFNGILGTSWGNRFEVSNNPQAHEKYPIHELAVANEEGEKISMSFPFTFADLAALNPSFHNHFMLVEPAFWNDNLIPITDYIDNNAADNVGKVPFIWMMNSANELQKVAVSWSIVLATQERLDFWRFLQESSGINNYHVGNALVTAREEFDKELNATVEQLKAEHSAEVQKVREEESGKVMENLTSVLLNLDTSNVVTTSAPATSAPSASPEADATDAPQEEQPAVEEESVLSNDPYIDTALCTSCNECINMNGQLFKYNGDKMAYIADPKAGTFKELVEAAELCPVTIIHPGSPLDPNEDDLDSLVERAAKFN